jgi:hypothetical protein
VTGFVAETRIKLLNGTESTVQEIFYSDTIIYGYSLNQIGLTVDRLMGLKRETGRTVVITLDDETRLTVGPNQLFLLRNRQQKVAESLTSGDSLMPLYTHIPKTRRWKGYEISFDPIKNKEIPTHVVVGSWKYPGMYPASGYVIHHWNYKALDNSPENLILMTFKHHVYIHSVLLKERWATDKNYRDRVSQSSRQYLSNLWKDDEFRARRAEISSETFKMVWRDEEFRAKMVDLKRDEMQANWQNPSFIEAFYRGRHNFWHTPEFEESRKRRKERVKESLGKNWTTQDRREKLEKAKWRNREKKGHTLENIQKIIVEKNVRTLSSLAEELKTDRKQVRSILSDAGIEQTEHKQWVRNYGKNHKVVSVSEGPVSDLYSLSGVFAVGSVFVADELKVV